MTPTTIALTLVVVGLGIMLLEMFRTPAGIQREHRIERGRISSSTRTVVDASPDEVIGLLQSDWSWWKKSRAEPARPLGNGLKEFVFHPVRYFNLIEQPTSFLVRFERIETLPDGGRRIHATLKGDFDGRGEYTARPGPGGTTVELAWRDAEVRGVLTYMPISLVAAIHCWRERLGVQGLRDRLAAAKS